MDRKPIEQVVIDYLQNKLSCGVHASEPEQPRPGEAYKYCVVQRTGGSERDHIRHTTVAVLSYADTLYKAAVLHEKVIAAVQELVELPEISGCRLVGDAAFSKTLTKQPRYQAVFDITHY